MEDMSVRILMAWNKIGQRKEPVFYCLEFVLFISLFIYFVSNVFYEILIPTLVYIQVNACGFSEVNQG